MQLFKNPQHIAEHLKKKRLELRLKQSEVAKLIGISEDSVTLWENGKSLPQIKHYPKIIDFLGYCPFPTNNSTIGGKIKEYRINYGLSHKKLGKIVGVDASTICSWENNQTVPSSENLKKLKELIEI